MAKRAWSEKLAKGVVTVVLLHRPVGADENLIHAWDALAAAQRGESPDANRAYAARRLAEADVYLRDYPERKIRFRKLFLVELEELRSEIAAA